jgi:hypothetical protein
MEQQYKSFSQFVRHQVRKQGTAEVSVNLYKVAIDDAKKGARSGAEKEAREGNCRFEI